MSTEFSHAAHDALWDGIRAAGVQPVHCGLIALQSLRLQKGDRDFAMDTDNTDRPLQAGLRFVVDFNKGGFVGQGALPAQKAAGPLPRRLVQFLLTDPEPPLHGNEPIPCDGTYVGYIRAGAFGPPLRTSVDLGIVEHAAGVTPDFLRSHHFEIEVNDRRTIATPSLSALYDPRSEHARS